MFELAALFTIGVVIYLSTRPAAASETAEPASETAVPAKGPTPPAKLPTWVVVKDGVQDALDKAPEHYAQKFVDAYRVESFEVKPGGGALGLRLVKGGDASLPHLRGEIFKLDTTFFGSNSMFVAIISDVEKLPEKSSGFLIRIEDRKKYAPAGSAYVAISQAFLADTSK